MGGTVTQELKIIDELIISPKKRYFFIALIFRNFKTATTDITLINRHLIMRLDKASIRAAAFRTYSGARPIGHSSFLRYNRGAKKYVCQDKLLKISLCNVSAHHAVGVKKIGDLCNGVLNYFHPFIPLFVIHR